MQEYGRRHSHFGFVTTIVLLTLLCIALLIMLAGDILIPRIAEEKVNVLLNTLALRGNAEFRIKSIDMSSAEVSCIFKNTDAQYGVGKIGSLSIRYSIGDLLKGRIESVSAENCDILLYCDKDSFSIPALDIFKGDDPKEEKKESKAITDLNALIPVRVDHITVAGNVAIVTKTDLGTDLSFVPYQISLTPDEIENWNRLDYRFSAYNSMNAIKINGSYMHPKKQLRVNLDQLTASSVTMPGVIKEKIPKGLRASLDVSSDIYFDLDTLSPQKDSGISGKMKVSYRDRALKLNVDTRADFKVTMPENGEVMYEIEGISGEYDKRRVSIPKISGTANLMDLTADGSFSLEIPESDAADFVFHCEKKDDAIKAKLSLTNSPVLNVPFGEMKFTYQPQTFRADASWDDWRDLKSMELSALLDGKSLGFRNPVVNCNADGLYATVSSHDGKLFDIHSNLNVISVTDADRKFVCTTPCVEIAATYRLGGPLRGETVCENALVRAPGFDAEARNVSWHIPFALSDDEQELQRLRGAVDIGEIVYQEHRAASIKSVLTWPSQHAIRLVADAELLAFLGNMTADVSFDDGMNVKCEFEIPEQKTDVSKHLVEFLPNFEEINCDGTISAHVVYSLTHGVMGGSAQFFGRDLHVAIPKLKLDVDGARFGFKIPDLKDLQSAPGQILSFKSLTFDQIKLGRFSAKYHMENPKLWQLENASLEWCDGHVRLGGITYEPGQTRYPVSLYCDRVDFPMLLTQLKLGKIDGSGKISGTIPVFISEENIVFQDAFLFSTPGEEGNIQAEFDQSSMSDSVEMRLACDALKDFSYQWVRLKVDSEKRDGLKLSISLDGKPNQPLYYSFDNAGGGFVPSTVPCVFQGITLDFNLSVSSDKLFELWNYFSRFKITK